MSGQAPRVSVVIPAYNAGPLIDVAIRSVARQTLRDLEVIIVDDASTDDTAGRARALLEQCGLRHTVVRQEVNAGPSAARNRGVALASGEYVAFLDADDEWLPGKLDLQVALMDRHPYVTLCGCQADWVDPRGALIRPLYEGLPELLPEGWKLLLWNCYVATPCAMARRIDLGVRPFDPALRVGEDRDLWIRLATNGTVGLVNSRQVIIRMSVGSHMARHAMLVMQDTMPMIRRHLARMGGLLSWRDRQRAIGLLHSQIGKSLDGVAGQYWRSARHLGLAVLCGYRPFDSLRQILYTAPGFRGTKAFIKARLQA